MLQRLWPQKLMYAAMLCLASITTTAASDRDGGKDREPARRIRVRIKALRSLWKEEKLNHHNLLESDCTQARRLSTSSPTAQQPEQAQQTP